MSKCSMICFGVRREYCLNACLQLKYCPTHLNSIYFPVITAYMCIKQWNKNELNSQTSVMKMLVTVHLIANFLYFSLSTCSSCTIWSNDCPCKINVINLKLETKDMPVRKDFLFPFYACSWLWLKIYSDFYFLFLRYFVAAILWILQKHSWYQSIGEIENILIQGYRITVVYSFKGAKSSTIFAVSCTLGGT